MNPKKLTKDQLKNRKEAWDAICGHGLYTKTTASEPTNEQIQAIRNAFSKGFGLTQCFKFD